MELDDSSIERLDRKFYRLPPSNLTHTGLRAHGKQGKGGLAGLGV